MNIQKASEILGVQPKDIRRMARKHFSSIKEEEGKNWDLSLSQVEFIGVLLSGVKGKRTKSSTVHIPKPVPQSDKIEELKTFAHSWLTETYGLDLNIPLYRNNRLKRSLGRFRHRTNGQPVDIELAGDLLNHHPEEEIIDVLKHELVHYALFTLGKPFHDGHPHFEGELIRLGIGATQTIQHRGIAHLYKCSACQKESENRRKLTLHKYRSRCCTAPLEYGGQVNR